MQTNLPLSASQDVNPKKINSETSPSCNRRSWSSSSLQVSRRLRHKRQAQSNQSMQIHDFIQLIFAKRAKKTWALIGCHTSEVRLCRTPPSRLACYWRVSRSEGGVFFWVCWTTSACGCVQGCFRGYLFSPPLPSLSSLKF